jgi:fumarate reductase flavoprotein subunit
MVDARFAIIGGGIAGLSAAIRAAQLKIPVVLFEMTAHLGGDVLFCDGWSAGAGTMMQKAAGIDDSPELMYQELTVDRFNANSSTVWYEDQFRQICENNGPTVDWMDQYIGVHYDKRQVTRGTYGWDLTPRIYYTAGGFNIIDPMIQKIEEGISDGYITVMLEYEITKLVTDGSEKVIGIETTNPAGEAETFNFDAILMATGGFVNDNTMRRENMGKGVMGFGSTPKYANSLKLVEDVGGRFVNMKSTGGYGAGLDTGSPDICRYHIDYFYPYAFWVGKDGKRLLDEYKDFQGHMTFWRTVEDRIGWVIFPKDKRLDQRAIIKKGGFHNVDMSPWESWQFFDELLEQGQGIWEADTIEEIAQKMGVDAAGLTNTCEEINAAFSSGTADSFGRTKLCDMSGPFYAAKCYAWAISTSASCEVDIDFHVLDANNNPIPGLFVAGQLLGIQTPPTTKNQGGTGCSGAFPNQGRMAIERMIKEYTGEDTALASFTTNAVADDYNVEIWPMLLEKEDVLGYIDEP